MIPTHFHAFVNEQSGAVVLLKLKELAGLPHLGLTATALLRLGYSPPTYCHQYLPAMSGF